MREPGFFGHPTCFAGPEAEDAKEVDIPKEASQGLSQGLSKLPTLLAQVLTTCARTHVVELLLFTSVRCVKHGLS